MRYSCFLPWWYEILLLWCHLFVEVPQWIRNTEWLERLRWEDILGDEERFSEMKKGYVCLPCYGGWRWTVIGNSLVLVEVLFFYSCRQPMRDWSIWLHVLSSLSELFDKLFVISTKLSVHMTGVDEAKKDWCFFDIWDRRFDKLPVISAKLSLRVMGADASGKARCLSDFWACLFDFWIGLFEFWARLFDLWNPVECWFL